MPDSMKWGYSTHRTGISIQIDLSRFKTQLEEAQRWLGDTVLHDCRALMPLQTGSLQQRSHVADGGKMVIFPGPYARFQSGGKVMIDPETGSPWARKGAKKVLTDRDLTYSQPAAVAHWYDAAEAANREVWIAGVKKRAGGGK